ncbi:uncharacterized membrane protein YoaK (UPF0700 family) [Volucribacter psittacicida]|uniref:Uncharacterized membrane protein YoaK (UPF0700 family) n=1 Tax=Volucribacter psittacicida TaxID=203482 RepID=A0A4R1FRN9_9PAST|nr:YoaK family protein [Volucribacter psittacicida]TCJ96242.1 uncharacterized membrane protein YoaK (UPF0700 family) [Volucribacter psittacicida]
MQNPLRIMPQNSRLIAVLLAFISGAADVYSHSQFQSLVATQTGNFILMANDLLNGNFPELLAKAQSLLFFTLGFVYGARVKQRAKTAYWRSYTIALFLLFSLGVPLLTGFQFIQVALLAFGTGLIMQTFNDGKIEDKPYTVMVASGNYRKMLNSWYTYHQEKNANLKHIAINYSALIISFICGVIISVIACKIFQQYAIWLISIVVLIILAVYSWTVWRYQLAQKNK